MCNIPASQEIFSSGFEEIGMAVGLYSLTYIHAPCKC